MPSEEEVSREDPSLQHGSPNESQAASEGWNLAVLAIQNVVLRVGWVFKTESVIMPAFLDAVSGAGWMRGWLPILSRIGQSLPPLIYADRLRSQPVKKNSLVLMTMGMAVPFLILSGVWSLLEEKRQPWFPPLFLVLYLVFFSATGLNQLAFGTVQGKLIRPRRRGRLMGISGIVGSIFAVSAALLWLRDWLSIANSEGYTYVFLFNGAAFLLAGIVAAFCREIPDDSKPKPFTFKGPFADAWDVYRRDRDFRRAATVSMLYMGSVLLLPHYQWLGRERIGTTPADLIVWIVVQNISVGLYSPLFGMLADRYGNRLAIRVEVFAAALTPLSALLFASGWIPNAQNWYWVTFVLLGLTPVTMKTIMNYTLELTESSEHPKYLSTMRVCFALPFVISPFVGLMIDLMPYAYTFSVMSVAIALGGCLTYRMVEPRPYL